MAEAGREWLVARRRAVGRLLDHASRGLVDNDIKDFLITLNIGRECLFTTSSCSGRIAVIEGEDIFNKKNARILAAWHDPSECMRHVCHTLEESSPKNSREMVWVSLQPPILHIATHSLETAKKVIACGDRAGFNRACMRPYKPGGYHIELAVSDKLTILGGDCRLARRACVILAYYKDRLRRLQDCLLEIKC